MHLNYEKLYYYYTYIDFDWFTSLVKTSSRDLESKIFTNEEEIKLLSDKKELILLEHNFLSSPERLYELKKLLFNENLISINLKNIF